MKNLLWLLMLGVVAIFTGPVLTGENAPHLKHGRERLERRDHPLLRALIAEDLNAEDTDHDGKLDHGELKAVLDKDHDGKVDHGEWRNEVKAIKEKLDTDKDGKLEPKEVEGVLEKIREKFPKYYEHLIKRLRERREREREREKKDK